jgi:AcrR family transcriptional regulator
MTVTVISAAKKRRVSKKPNTFGRATYHHGNLRHALIEAARELVETQGADGFTLREAARKAGVSHGAPAHHFSDKAGLLTALAAQAIRERLTLTRKYIAAAGPDLAAQMKAHGMAQIDYMISHPGLTDVMSRLSLVNRDDPELVEAFIESVGEYMALLNRATGAGLGIADVASPDMLLSVSVVQGFAALVNNRQVFHDVPAEHRHAAVMDMAGKLLDRLSYLTMSARKANSPRSSRSS